MAMDYRTEWAGSMVALDRAISRQHIAIRSLTLELRARAVDANKAFRSINGQSPVDARRYTDAEYRYYSDLYIRAQRLLERARADLDALLARRSSLEYRLGA